MRLGAARHCTLRSKHALLLLVARTAPVTCLGMPSPTSRGGALHANGLLWRISWCGAMRSGPSPSPSSTSACRMHPLSRSTATQPLLRAGALMHFGARGTSHGEIKMGTERPELGTVARTKSTVGVHQFCSSLLVPRRAVPAGLFYGWARKRFTPVARRWRGTVVNASVSGRPRSRGRMLG